MRPRPGLSCLLLLSLAVAGRSQGEVETNSTLSEEDSLDSSLSDDPTLSEDVPEETKDIPASDLGTRVSPSSTSPVFSLEGEVARSELAVAEARRSLEEAELEATEIQGRLGRWEGRYSHGLNVFVSWMMANSLCYDERISNTDINQLWRHSRSLSQHCSYQVGNIIHDLLL